MPPDLLKLINTVRANKLQPTLAAIQPNDRLRETLGFDSMDLAELTVRIEECFGVDVFANGLVQTVGEIAAKLTTRRCA